MSLKALSKLVGDKGVEPSCCQTVGSASSEEGAAWSAEAAGPVLEALQIQREGGPLENSENAFCSSYQKGFFGIVWEIMDSARNPWTWKEILTWKEKSSLKSILEAAGWRMAWQVKPLAAFMEDPSSVLGTNTVPHNHL